MLLFPNGDPCAKWCVGRSVGGVWSIDPGPFPTPIASSECCSPIVGSPDDSWSPFSLPVNLFV